MSLPEEKRSDQPATPEPGAYAAWGLLAGMLSGAILGWIFGQTLVGLLFVGLLGWVAGAFYERSRP